MNRKNCFMASHLERHYSNFPDHNDHIETIAVIIDPLRRRRDSFGFVASPRRRRRSSREDSGARPLVQANADSPSAVTDQMRWLCVRQPLLS